MPNSTHFAFRAAHYRQLAAAASNEKMAEYSLGLANLFLQMSVDLRRMEFGSGSGNGGLKRGRRTGGHAGASGLEGPSQSICTKVSP